MVILLRYVGSMLKTIFFKFYSVVHFQMCAFMYIWLVLQLDRKLPKIKKTNKTIIANDLYNMPNKKL